MEVKGKDLMSGIPKTITISYKEIAHALNKSIIKIEEAVLRALELTPPELSADIYERGIYLTGGGALLRGLDKRLSEKTKLPVHVAKDPLEAVVRGTGIALKNIDKFKSESDFSTWFYRIAANHCWMKFRKRKREKLVSIEDVKDLAHYEKDRNVEISHDFYKILAMLPLDFRMAVTLVDIEGFSLKDAAKELNITVGALKSRLFRARNMFKKKMEEEDKKGFE
jgi:RNA polymerase sigma factor (sigma-70 family)